MGASVNNAYINQSEVFLHPGDSIEFVAHGNATAPCNGISYASLILNGDTIFVGGYSYANRIAESFLAKEGKYAFYVFGDGPSEITFTVIFNSTGVAELDSRITIFPIPVVDVLHFSAEEIDLRQVQVTDNLGKLVFAQTINRSTTQIDLSGLQAGVYILRLRDDNKREMSRRLVKQ